MNKLKKLFIKASFATLVAATAVIGLGSCTKTNPSNTNDPSNNPPTTQPGGDTTPGTQPGGDTTQTYYLSDSVKYFIQSADAFDSSVNQSVQNVFNEENNNYVVRSDVNVRFNGLNVSFIADTYNNAKQNKEVDQNANKLYNLLGGNNFALTATAQEKLANGEELKFDLKHFENSCKNNVAYFVALEGLDSFTTLYKPNTDFYKDLEDFNELYNERVKIYRYNTTAVNNSSTATLLYSNQVISLHKMAQSNIFSQNTYFSEMQKTSFQELAVFADSLECKIGDVDYLSVASYDSSKNFYANIMNYMNAQGYDKYGYTIENSANNESLKTNDYAEFKNAFLENFTEEKSYTTNINANSIVIDFGDHTITATAEQNSTDFEEYLNVAQKSKAYTVNMSSLEESIRYFNEIPIACDYTNSSGIRKIYSYYSSTEFNSWTVGEYEAEFGPITDEYVFGQTNDSNQNQPGA